LKPNSETDGKILKNKEHRMNLPDKEYFKNRRKSIANNVKQNPNKSTVENHKLRRMT